MRIALYIFILMIVGCGRDGAMRREQPRAPVAAASTVAFIDGAPYFGDRQACFAMLDHGRDHWVLSDERRCKQRFRPFSTFKIPNALIGLETGVLAGAETVIEWDAKAYPPEDWWPDAWRAPNDLRSAMKHSAVPYFRALARRIGTQAMQDYLRRFGYGNQQMGGGLDRFWLDGDLAISAVEQIEFLRALYQGKLPASRRSVDIVKEILLYERGPGYVIRAKTGLGSLTEDHALGWWVGHVERESDVYIFAMNMSGTSVGELKDQRIPLTRQILTDLGVLPKDSAQP